LKYDDGSGNHQQSNNDQQSDDPAIRFWDVVGQLAGTGNYTADYQNATFEPIIGFTSTSQPYTRIVNTNDMASAADRFAKLAGIADFDANTTDYTWHDDAVGTLTYHKVEDGTSLATVEVSIPQMPHLQQIVYRSPDQSDANGWFNGTAYYRFGDVLARSINNNALEYWICVRPAFGPEKKEDSHWISISPLPEKNIWKTTKYDKNYSLPTGLGTNEEQMQNLAELLYAMLYSEKWEENVLNSDPPSLFFTGLRTFHDFSHKLEMVQYHNQYFWKKVRSAWDQQDLFKTIFGFKSKSEQFETIIDNGLHLLAKGYSWWSKTSGNLSLYEYTYSNDGSFENNMHTKSYREIKKDMSQQPESNIDVATQYTQQKPYLVNSWYFGDDEPRFIIRHATGKQLCPEYGDDPKHMFTNMLQTYVYNSFWYQETDKKFVNLDDPELEVAENSVVVNDLKDQDRSRYRGSPHYHLGDVYQAQDSTIWYCLLPAGGSNSKRPFSYFISFDMITTDDYIATNIVDMETAIKTTAAMAYIYDKSVNGTDTGFYKNLLDHIATYAHFDWRKMFIQKKDNRGANDQVLLASVAYMPDVNYYFYNDYNQCYLRFMLDKHYSPNSSQSNYRFWSHYTNLPRTDVAGNDGKAFSQTPIKVIDCYDADMVSLYADDEFMTHDDMRKTVEPGKFNINNYLWKNGAFVSKRLSMWNEPILHYRIEAVYDRGNESYSTVTDFESYSYATGSKEGLKFKLLKSLPPSAAGKTKWDKKLHDRYDHEFDNNIPQINTYMFLDGKMHNLKLE